MDAHKVCADPHGHGGWMTTFKSRGPSHQRSGNYVAGFSVFNCYVESSKHQNKFSKAFKV